jgi:hypothetical protein
MYSNSKKVICMYTKSSTIYIVSLLIYVYLYNLIGIRYTFKLKHNDKLIYMSKFKYIHIFLNVYMLLNVFF